MGPFLTKRMAEARTYVAIREMSEAGDKPAKARSFQGRMATGKAAMLDLSHKCPMMGQ